MCEISTWNDSLTKITEMKSYTYILIYKIASINCWHCLQKIVNCQHILHALHAFIYTFIFTIFIIKIIHCTFLIKREELIYIPHKIASSPSLKLLIRSCFLFLNRCKLHYFIFFQFDAKRLNRGILEYLRKKKNLQSL